MASVNDTAFAAYAGQEVAGGTRTNPYNSPVVAFGDPFDATALANLAAVNGLLPKIGKTLIHETAIYDPEILKIFKQADVPFGVAVEDFAFSAPGVNIKSDGTCLPRHTDVGTSQLSAANLAFNSTINVYDREVNKALLSEDEIAAYVSEKVKLLRAGFMDQQMAAAIHLISDATAGKRAITSKTASDGTGTSVSFATKPAGWAKVIKTHDKWVVPEVSALGSEPSIANEVTGESTIDMVLDLMQEIKAVTSGMKYPSNTMNKAGIKTFSKEINVVMETHVLDAFDRVIQDQSKNYYEGATARGFIGGLERVRLVEVPSFEALPAYDSSQSGSTDYTGYRMVAAIIDSDGPAVFTHDYSMESGRCMGERMQSYNMQAEQTWRIWNGANTGAILCHHTASS